MRNPVRDKSVEYADNRISLYSAQHGKCAVTGVHMDRHDIHCHHKIPVSMGGTDNYDNLTLVCSAVHAERYDVSLDWLVFGSFSIIKHTQLLVVPPKQYVIGKHTRAGEFCLSLFKRMFTAASAISGRGCFIVEQ